MNEKTKTLIETHRTEASDEVAALLTKLTAWVETERQRADVDWAVVGDLNHVREQLQVICAFAIGEPE